MIETILKYFDWSVTFLHASIQFALGVAFIFFSLFFLTMLVFHIIRESGYFKRREKRIEFLESEVKRLKLQIFKMGFTEQAEK